MEDVSEFVKRSMGVSNLTCLSIICDSAVVFISSFLVGEHAVPRFSVENLVVNATVVSGLRSQIVKLLTQLCNELVFLTSSDFDTRIRAMVMVIHIRTSC